MPDARARPLLAPHGAGPDGPAEPGAPPPPDPGADAFEARRMAALAFLAGGIAHDLANPLAAIIAFSSSIGSDPRLPADLRDDAGLLRDEASRTNRTTRALLELARERPATAGPVDVRDALGDVLELIPSVLAHGALDIDVPADLPPVAIDQARLRHLVLVLCVEAIRSLGPGPATGRLRISAAPAPGHTVVRVRIEHTREPGREAMAGGGSLAPLEGFAAGLGVGLLSEALEGGGRFVLDIPVHEVADGDAFAERPPAGQSATRGSPDLARAPGPVVLVCDDDEAIRALIARVLGRGGCRVLQAASGRDAIELLGSTPVEVVLTDHRMRAMSGIELFEHAVSLRPGLRSRFVLMSGDAGAADLVAFTGRTGLTVLEKPFEPAALMEAVRAVAGTRGQQRE